MGDIGHFVKYKNLFNDIGYLMQDEVFKKIFNKNVIAPCSNSLKVNLISFDSYINDNNKYNKEKVKKEVKYANNNQNGIKIYPSLIQKIQNRNIIMLSKRNTIAKYETIANSLSVDGYDTYSIDNSNKINNIITSYISKQSNPKTFLLSTSINTMLSYLSTNNSVINYNAFILYQNTKDYISPNAQKKLTKIFNSPLYIYNTIPSLHSIINEIYNYFSSQNKVMISTTHISKKEPLFDSIYLNDIKYWLSHI